MRIVCFQQVGGQRGAAPRPAGCGWSPAPRASPGRPASSPHGRPRPDAARNSVWPGKAKPAPSFSAFLLIGAVQIAAAWPGLRQGHRACDHLDHAGRIAGIRHCPALPRPANACASTGKTSPGRASASAGSAITCQRAPAGRCARIADPEERQFRRQCRPGLDRNFGADARRARRRSGRWEGRLPASPDTHDRGLMVRG